MKIFNEKTVVGLFDNDSAVEEALSTLQERGFGEEDEDDIRVIDQNRLPIETPINQPVQSSGPILPGTADAAASRSTVVSSGEEPDRATVRAEVKRNLADLGLSEDESDFFADHVSRGNPLVIVETSADRAQEALDIMQQANVTGTAT